MAYIKIKHSQSKYFNKYNIFYDGLLIFLRLYNIEKTLISLISNDIKSGNKQIVLFYDDYVNSYLNNINEDFDRYQININSINFSDNLLENINIKNKNNTVYLLEPPFDFFYRKELKNIVNKLKTAGVNLIILKESYNSFVINFHYSLRDLFFNIDTILLFRTDYKSEFINFLNIHPLTIKDLHINNNDNNNFYLFKNRELLTPYILSLA